MKLLFDQNLSPKLTGRLADVYPGSEHVADVGLGRALDQKYGRMQSKAGWRL